MRVQMQHYLALALAVPLVGFAQTGPRKVPARLHQFLTSTVRLSQAEYRNLMNGLPVTKLLDADPALEVAVFGAVWINAPRERYVALLQDIENFERGRGFRITKRISSPPQLGDFDRLQLPAEDLSDLRSCEVGDCEVKLGEKALRRFRAEVNWGATNWRDQANTLLGRIAHEYVTAYLAGGNDRLAVYRDDSRPTFVAREFRAMVDRMPSLSEYIPNVRRYLPEYPAAQLPNSTSCLYWQETRFGLKATIRISHLVTSQGSDDTDVASKMLYATHYFWTALELRILVPDPPRGRGFWFVTVSRSRSDGLGGFTGRLIRGRVRREALEGLLAALRSTKPKVEQAKRAASIRRAGRDGMQLAERTTSQARRQYQQPRQRRFHVPYLAYGAPARRSHTTAWARPRCWSRCANFLPG